MRFLVCSSVIGSAVSSARPSAGQTAEFSEIRHTFISGEVAKLHLKVAGLQSIKVGVFPWKVETYTCDGTRPAEFEFALDTARLTAGKYDVCAWSNDRGDSKPLASFNLTVAAPHDADRIGLWLWGGFGRDMPWWVGHGINGGFLPPISHDPSENEKEAAAIVGTTAPLLDLAAEMDFDLGANFETLVDPTLKADPSVRIALPDGKPYTGVRQVYPHYPKVVDQSKAAAKWWMQHFAQFPAMRHALANDEYEMPFAFNDLAIQQAKQDTGVDPRQFFASSGDAAPFVPPDLSSQVKNGIIPDDCPAYQFLRWWYTRGSGLTDVNAAIGAAVNEARPDIQTWSDPYRLAPVRGTHRGLDMVSSWTYPFPSIARLAYTTYLQAAARNAGEHDGDQLVKQCLNLSMYAQMMKSVDNTHSDLSRDIAGKNQLFYLLGPDQVSESLWLILSQRPDVIEVFGSGALTNRISTLDPEVASPLTWGAIGEFSDSMLKPFGPAIRKSHRIRPKSALLASAAACWFQARPGGKARRYPGYATEQTLPFAELLMRKHVPFDVVLDEDVAGGKLSNYDVLFIPQGDAITQSMSDQITKFVHRGGKVIAEQSFAATIPEVVKLNLDFSFTNFVDGTTDDAKRISADQYRDQMDRLADSLTEPTQNILRPADTSSKQVFINMLDGGAVKYYFIINDAHVAGPRFGADHVVNDLGVPQSAKLLIQLNGAKGVYDAQRKQPIQFLEQQDGAELDLQLPPAQGRLIAVVDHEIEAVAVKAPKSIQTGELFQMTVSVLDHEHKAMTGAFPLHIEVDKNGNSLPLSRYVAIDPDGDGTFALSFVAPVNLPSGTWHVRVTDLISGKVATTAVECNSTLAATQPTAAP